MKKFSQYLEMVQNESDETSTEVELKKIASKLAEKVKNDNFIEEKKLGENVLGGRLRDILRDEYKIEPSDWVTKNWSTFWNIFSAMDEKFKNKKPALVKSQLLNIEKGRKNLERVFNQYK
jgi:hypothetical protein